MKRVSVIKIQQELGYTDFLLHPKLSSLDSIQDLCYHLSPYKTCSYWNWVKISK